MRLLSLLSTLLFAGSALAVPVFDDSAPKSFSGTKVIRVTIGNSAASANRLQALVKKLDLELWSRNFKAGQDVDIQVAPEKLNTFQAATTEWKKSVMHEDLGESIEVFENQPAVGDGEMRIADVSAAAVPDLTWFNSYHTYAEHSTFLDNFVATYPTKSKIVTAGTSYEGRSIRGIHIYGTTAGTKPGVIVHATVHAREWITTMTAEYFIYQLLAGTDTDVATLLTKYEFYIFPVVNPDGFVYTQTTNRLWRKSRQPNSSASCPGTDLNRNWPNQWSGSGSSTSQCDETYRGATAGSSPEVKGLLAFQNGLSVKPKFYMDLHAYAQSWMFPLGYSCSGSAPDNAALAAMATGAIAALKAVSGTVYKSGPICKTIYAVNGDSVDYSYEVTGIKYSYTAELRDTGTNGFVLPAAQILPTGKETWAGIKYIWKNMV